MNPTFTKGNYVFIDQVNKCHDTYEGAAAVQKYLLQSNSESGDEFGRRKEISSLSTTYRKGITGFVDILFRKKITISDDTPANVQEYYETADGRNSLNEVAKLAAKEMFLSNDVYGLVWTPPNTAQDAAEEISKGIRPYIEIIDATRIVDTMTRYDSSGNIQHITVEGSFVKEETRYEVNMGREYRVYFNDGLVEIWREDKRGDIILYDSVQSEVRSIPVVKMTFDDSISAPPFINECNIQLQHYNIESSKDSYNIKLAFPFVVSHGLLANSSGIATDDTDDDGNPIKTVQFQSSKGIDFSVNPETGARLGDVEIKELSGSADAILKRTLDDKTKAITNGFVTVTTEGSGNKTVVESQSERVSGESMLASTATKIEEFLNRLNALMCEYSSVPVSGNIIMNTDFVIDELDTLEYNMLKDLLAEDIIDKQEFITELQAYGKLKNIDAEKLMSRLIATGRQ